MSKIKLQSSSVGNTNINISTNQG